MKKIDFHVHINSPIPIEDTVKYFNDMCKRFGYCGVGIMSTIAASSHGDDPECNNRALEIKRLMPGSFAFASLDHKRDFISQTREYMSSGFDGIKILEGKPSVYRYYGYGLDCERFDRFSNMRKRNRYRFCCTTATPNKTGIYPAQTSAQKKKDGTMTRICQDSSIFIKLLKIYSASTRSSE